MTHLRVATLLAVAASSALAQAGSTAFVEESLMKKAWMHGARDCKASNDPAVEIYRHTPRSYILRQNKCSNFEAPFVYVLQGDEKTLVLDTGAPADNDRFPIHEAIATIIAQESHSPGTDILVIHSHSHRDHYAGDEPFNGAAPPATVAKPTRSGVIEHFDFDHWPAGQARIQLGGREVIVIPTPGHQEEAISVYDPETLWLLTGDTLYPGYIYVKDWEAYRKSIDRLAEFSRAHKVSAILGAHIEMTHSEGEYYPIGTTYQPNEAPLPLPPDTLFTLKASLDGAEQAQEINHGTLIVAPMNVLQKSLSNLGRWLSR